MNASSHYPDIASKRSQWIRKLRKEVKRPTEASIPNTLLETETAPDGNPIQSGTIFLINKECPWTCVMCDLWQHTTKERLPPGHITQQIKDAIIHLQSKSKQCIQQIKIYNSGSFFDRGAIPVEEYGDIALVLAEFERVIVECHPRLIGDQTMAFAQMLKPKLEVAMGLEIASDDILQRLNKRFTIADYKSACTLLHKHSIDHRAFVMIQPPYIHPHQTKQWCLNTVKLAFGFGAASVSIIPTRATTGAMQSLLQNGELHPLSIEKVESCFDASLNLNLGRVCLDLWDLEQLQTCAKCFEKRRERMEIMNATQSILPKSICPSCQIT